MVLEKNEIPPGDELLAHLMNRIEKLEADVEELRQRRKPVRLSCPFLRF